MRVFVKICGITCAEDFAAVTALRPDAVGFVFWPGSTRCVAPEVVGRWTAPPGILKVGVFVDSPPDEVARVVRAAGLDVVQLHGEEKVADYRGIAARTWKAVHLDAGEAVQVPEDADAVLIDRYEAGMPGGTGKVCDWTRAAAFTRAVACPVLLAGGLTPANVAEAVGRVRPWGVDVSSGVEQAPGRKDIGNVERFIACCRTK